MFFALQIVCKKEGLQLPLELAKKIVEKSERNLRLALLMCESCKVQETPLKEKQEPILPQWQIFLRDTARTIMNEQSPKQLMEVRGKLYELLSHNIPVQIIFKVPVLLLKSMYLKMLFITNDLPT